MRQNEAFCPCRNPVPCTCAPAPCCAAEPVCATDACNPCVPVPCPPPKPACPAPKPCSPQRPRPCPPPRPRPCPPPRPKPCCPPQPVRPPCECRCDTTCAPQPACAYLMPRIVGSGREWMRRTQATLCVRDVPECAGGAYTLISVSTSGEAASWEASAQPSPGRTALRVTIPLSCQVRDGNGRLYTGRAELQTDVALRITGPQADCWRNTLMLLPCVRLICLPEASCNLCFDAQLEVLLDAYVLRWEPRQENQASAPNCCAQKALPLYPQLRLK